MRIGIDCRIYSPRFTGIGRYVYELVEHIIKINDSLNKKHEIVLFFNNPEYENFKIPNESVKKILAKIGHYSFAEQIKFPKILKKENLDIVHFPHFNLPILYRRPYIVTIHDLILTLFPGKKMTKWFQRLAYYFIIKNAVRTAKKVITVSKNTKNDLMKFLKVPEKKIEVIYNGISPEFKIIDDQKILEKTLSKYKIKTPFLLYTGVWRSHKNLVRLLEALSYLKNEKGLELNLVITGKKDPHYPEIEYTTHTLDLEKNVTFTGQVDEEDLVNLYNSALFYVFPSLYEGFGLTPLEAMKCGTPVIASNTSSIPEICGEKNAIFFDPYNIKDIAEKIYELYKDPLKQAKLEENGLTHASKFSWKTSIDKTFKIVTNNY